MWSCLMPSFGLYAQIGLDTPKSPSTPLLISPQSDQVKLYPLHNEHKFLNN